MPRPTRVAAITFKKFSLVEYVLPILWELRQQQPDAAVQFFFCSGNESQVFREDTFLRRTLLECNVHIASFFKEGGKKPWYARKFFRKIVSKLKSVSNHSIVDLSRFANELETQLYPKPYARDILPLVLKQANNQSEIDLVHGLEIRRFLTALEDFHPDVILLDCKTIFYAWPALRTFLDYVAQHEVRIIVPPEVTYPAQFYNFSDALPESLRNKFEYWWPYGRGTDTMESYTSNREDCLYLSAPCMDSSWLQWLKKKNIKPDNGRVQCLYVIRKFFPKDAKPDALELADLSYDQFLETTRIILKSLERIGEFDLIVKPYPTMTNALVEEAMKELKVRHYRITFDSVYSLIGLTDLCLCEFSSAVMPLLASQTPTLLLTHSIYSELLETYPPFKPSMESIREMFPLSTDLEKTFTQSLDEQIDTFLRKEQMSRRLDHCEKIMRRFFPDGACERHAQHICSRK
ncbi:MAG: hypothetical protein B9S32_11525 [Verrucomicrobia bacterium Tous-C9LFEB]|nr:MAG: hypothetical protein B9S32_11525 [Verrucomicrobia bacterium Tous-C9LFEB]